MIEWREWDNEERENKKCASRAHPNDGCCAVVVNWRIR